MMQRSADWVDQRKSQHQQLDDSSLMDQIVGVIDEQASYGYRRILALLKHQQQLCVNHKRIYRVKRECYYTVMESTYDGTQA